MWIDIDKQQPEEGQLCIVIDPFGKEDQMYYQPDPIVTLPNGSERVVGRDLFYNNRGFLTDDVKWWKPAEEEG